MYDVEKEKNELLLYLKSNTFNNKSGRGDFIDTECLKIGIEVSHCMSLLEELERSGFIIILEEYCTNKNPDGLILREYIAGQSKKPDCFSLKMNKSIKYPNSHILNDMDDLLIRLDENDNLIYDGIPIDFPLRSGKIVPKYQLIIKQIIRRCPNGGEITYPAIREQLKGKISDDEKISSLDIIEFFRRAKVKGEPIPETVVVRGITIKTFDTSRRLKVMFTNKRSD